MKKYVAIGILSVVIFSILTVSTAKIETPADGNDSFGFPGTFFIRFGGKGMNDLTKLSEIFYLNLLIDVVVALIIATLIRMVYVMLRKYWAQHYGSCSHTRSVIQHRK